MADLSDVENAIVGAITAAVYPTGPSQASAIGAAARVYRGWPNGVALDNDLAAGIVNVSVFCRTGFSRNTTRYPNTWEDGGPPSLPMTVSLSGAVVTIAGTGGVAQNIGVRTNDGTWITTTSPTDTPATAATALGALIPGAAVSGTQITVPGINVVARTGAVQGIAFAELRRQVQGFLISCWCPTPVLRDRTASVVDGALAAIDFLPLSDGTAGWLVYRGTTVDDAPSKDALWRRDLNYTVEYATMANAGITPAQMLFGGGIETVNGDSTAVAQIGDLAPSGD